MTGSAQVGATLGTLTGKFYGNTSSYVLSASSNAALFAALKTYLEAGNSAIVLYNGETSSSSGYSPNYARITSATISVTYVEGKSTGSVTVGTYGASSVPVSVAISANSAAYTHKVTFAFDSNTSTVTVAAGATSASYTASYAYLPNATSGALTVTIETLSGTTSLGTNTYSVNISIPSTVVPTIGSVTATPVYQNVSSAAQGWELFIQGMTKVTVSMGGVSAGSGASIASYSISSSIGGGSSSSYTSGILTNSGTYTFTCKVTDSRERSASKTVSIDVYAYAAPTLTSYSLYRCTSAGTRADTDGKYARLQAYYACSSVNGKNAVTAKVVINNITTSIASGTAYTLGAGALAVDASYLLAITLTDTVGSSVTVNAMLPSASYLMHFRRGGKSIGIGRAAGSSDDKTVHVGWPMEFDNSGDGASQTARSLTMKNLIFHGWDPDIGDTVTEWANRGYCQVMLSSAQTKIALPVSGIWATLLSWGMYGTGSDVFQVCHEQPDGRTWVRSGNADGFRPWRQILDNRSPVDMYGGTYFRDAAALKKYNDGIWNGLRVYPSGDSGVSYVFYGDSNSVQIESDSGNASRTGRYFNLSRISNLEDALSLFDVVSGIYNKYRVYHSGMTNAIQPSDTGWIPLSLASGISAATQYAEYYGAAYRVVNGNHVYVRCGVAFDYKGSRLALTSSAIPAEYRPKHGAYAICAGNNPRLYRIVVNTDGIIELEWANVLGSSSTSGSFSVSWMDGRVDYFV